MNDINKTSQLEINYNKLNPKGLDSTDFIIDDRSISAKRTFKEFFTLRPRFRFIKEIPLVDDGQVIVFHNNYVINSATYRNLKRIIENGRK